MYKYIRVHYYGTHFRLICIKQGCSRKKEEKKPHNKEAYTKEIERISLSRTKREIKELALSNQFEYFATLTINANDCDRHHLQQCQDRLRKLLKKYKRKNKNFAYLFITEKHKDGAFHFHGLVKGLDKTDLERFRLGMPMSTSLANLVKNGEIIYHSKFFDELGFNSFSKIKNYFKCCNYILKYITKDCVRNENNQIYIRSRGLKFAERDEVCPIDIESIVADDDTALSRVYKSEYCVALDYDFDELSRAGKNIVYNLESISEFVSQEHL